MSKTITIEQPDTAEHESANQSIVIEAGQIVIGNAEDHAAAMGFLQRVASMTKSVKALFAAPKKAAHAAHKTICAAESSLLDPMDRASNLVRSKVLTYEREERARAEAEARRIAEAARIAEEERRLADAVQAESEGDVETADAIMDEPPVVAPVVAPAPRVADVAGVSRRIRWSAEVVDLLELVNHVAKNPEWLHLLSADMPTLHSLARSMKERLNIPGVRAVPEESLSVGAGRG